VERFELGLHLIAFCLTSRRVSYCKPCADYLAAGALPFNSASSLRASKV